MLGAPDLSMHRQKTVDPNVRFGSIVLKKSVPEAGLVWLGR